MDHNFKADRKIKSLDEKRWKRIDPNTITDLPVLQERQKEIDQLRSGLKLYSVNVRNGKVAHAKRNLHFVFKKIRKKDARDKKELQKIITITEN